MATPEITPAAAENAALQDLNADYTERYGFHDAENYLYKAPKGLTRELVEKARGEGFHSVNIDLIYGRNIAGENANWLTLGVNLRF